MAASTLSPPTIRWGDRVALRCGSAACTAAAICLAVATIVAAVSYAELAIYAESPLQRFGPAAVIAAAGSVASIVVYGIGRACRAVLRLCSAANDQTSYSFTTVRRPR